MHWTTSGPNTFKNIQRNQTFLLWWASAGCRLGRVDFLRFSSWTPEVEVKEDWFEQKSEALSIYQAFHFLCLGLSESASLCSRRVTGQTLKDTDTNRLTHRCVHTNAILQDFQPVNERTAPLMLTAADTQKLSRVIRNFLFSFGGTVDLCSTSLGLWCNFRMVWIKAALSDIKRIYRGFCLLGSSLKEKN